MAATLRLGVAAAFAFCFFRSRFPEVPGRLFGSSAGLNFTETGEVKMYFQTWTQIRTRTTVNSELTMINKMFWKRPFDGLAESYLRSWYKPDHQLPAVTKNSGSPSRILVRILHELQ